MAIGDVRITTIVAMTPERLIGRANDLPWYYPEDLRHFKRSTKGHTVVAGRKSWDSTNGALPKRLNVVVSRGVADERGTGIGEDGLERDGGTWFSSLDAVADWIDREPQRAAPTGEVFILGGGEIFRLTLAPLDGDADAPHEGCGPLVPDRLIVTYVPSEEIKGGDVFFPFDEEWIAQRYRVSEQWRGEDNEALRFVVYER